MATPPESAWCVHGRFGEKMDAVVAHATAAGDEREPLTEDVWSTPMTAQSAFLPPDVALRL